MPIDAALMLAHFAQVNAERVKNASKCLILSGPLED